MGDAVRTTCPYCGTGCGLVVEGTRIAGDPDHPANRGRLCSKGAALAETLGHETRLLTPEVDGRRVDWEDAIAEVAGRIRSVIELNGPDAFAFYLSGQLLSEDYYAANKLAKGFLGTANVDTNSRLCMASTVAGQIRAFGTDTVPGCYEDLELADLVVLVGSNLAWCHPVLFQRLRQAREERGTRVVVIDPRRTDSCDIADLHLAIAPGADVALFNRLLVHCAAAGAVDRDFIAAHTAGFAATLAAAEADGDIDLPPGAAQFFDWFAGTPRVVTVFSQGVNQSAAGTDKVTAIINAHLATGRIGKPGMGPFSVTGQPNAMGGREIGGLATQLAAHLDFAPANVERVRRFWRAPRMATGPGLKAMELFRAIDQGRVKAVWIIGTNPAVSLPEADLVRRALAKCPVVIASDCVADTDTLRLAHIRLPAQAWGEKDGTVTNSERTVSRQRPFLPAAGKARPDWWQVAEVARALGFGADFAWGGPAGIYREYAGLAALSPDIRLPVEADYQQMAPFQWGGERLFGDGRFFTTDRRARLVPVRHRSPAETVSPAYPLRLNTGRYRDHWHTLTRTGLSPRLSGHRPEPLLDINPADAEGNGLEGGDLEDGDLVRIDSRQGSYLARLRVTTDQPPGQVFLPMHWSDAFAAQAVAGRLLPGHADPLSGQPELKHAAVRVTAVPTSWWGLLVCARLPELAAPWWVRHAAAGAQVIEMAGADDAQRAAVVAALDAAFGAARLEVFDSRRGSARLAWMREGRLEAALFLSAERPALSAAWIAGQIGRDLAGPAERAAILAGRAPEESEVRGLEDGPIVCACFAVGLATILRAVATRGLATVAEIGAVLKAGTGCGSCIPELRKALPAERRAHNG